MDLVIFWWANFVSRIMYVSKNCHIWTSMGSRVEDNKKQSMWFSSIDTFSTIATHSSMDQRVLTSFYGPCNIWWTKNNFSFGHQWAPVWRTIKTVDVIHQHRHFFHYSTTHSSMEQWVLTSFYGPCNSTRYFDGPKLLCLRIRLVLDIYGLPCGGQ